MNLHLRVVVLAGLMAGIATGNDPRMQNAPIIEQALREPAHDGLLIFEVVPKLQAEKAGIRVGDIMTDYDGKQVRTVAQLQRIATAAAKSGRSRLPVIVRRGPQEIEAEFDAAPMGVRLVAVAKGFRRVLWRPATEYTPNFASIEKAIKDQHQWQLFQFAGKNMGWAHTYFTTLGNRTVMRVQSESVSEQANEKRDLVLSFDRNSKNLALKSYRLVINDKLMLDMHATDGVFFGTRAGIRDSAPMPTDCVSADLAGLVAATMSREKGSCMRCSYLEAGSVVAAPYADLFCIGLEQTDFMGSTISAVRYDQTVFGHSVAHYWINSKGDLVKTKFGNGFVVYASTEKMIQSAFPGCLGRFESIEKLPNIDPPASQLGQ